MTEASIYGQDNYLPSSSNKSEGQKSPVAIPSIGYEQMAEKWDLILDLLGGTLRMRKAAEKWLPRETSESITNYDARLNRAILYEGLKDTIGKLKDRPFTHPIQIIDLPEELSYLINDVDGNNKNLKSFLKEVLDNLIKYGIAHIFVSHSILEGVEEGKKYTIAEEKALGARVYLISISPVDLIGWQEYKDSNITELTQIRVKEKIIEAYGKYNDVEANYINVYKKDSWETHLQDDENQDIYEKVAEGSSNFNGGIPLITIYANRTGFMTAEPPLMGLAWLNLAHWQSYADQKNILHFSRFGILFGKGLPEKLVESGSLDIGPTKAILVDSEHGDLKYVEHQGKAIDAGQKDVEEIETKMRVLGNQPLIKNIPDSATGERIDEGRTVSQLQSWVSALQDGILQAFKYACKWRKIVPKETMNVEIYNDFEAVVLGGADKKLLLEMRQAGEITRERFLKEEQRRGVFSQDMNAEEEAKAMEAEGDNDLKDLLEEEPEEKEEEEIEENEEDGS